MLMFKSWTMEMKDSCRRSSLYSKREDCLKRGVTEFIGRMSGQDITRSTVHLMTSGDFWCGKIKVVEVRFIRLNLSL